MKRATFPFDCSVDQCSCQVNPRLSYLMKDLVCVIEGMI